NMRCRNASRGNAPAAVLEKERCFRLGSGKAELPCVSRQPPCGMIFTQNLHAFGDIGLVEPFDLILLAAEYGIKATGGHKLNGACAIFANMRDECKDIAG